MSPNFITKRLEPCAGTPVHELTCGHIVQASFLHPSTSSKCAPNCASVAMNTKAEPSFFCPTCHEKCLSSEYKEYIDRYTKMGKENGISLYNMLEREKMKFTVDGQAMMNMKYTKAEFDCWWDVLLGGRSFEKVCKEIYKRQINAGGLRACKAVEEDG